MPFSLLSGLPTAQQQILQQGFLSGLQRAAQERELQARLDAQKQEQDARQQFEVQQQQREWQHQAALYQQQKTDAAAELAKQNGVDYFKGKLNTYGQEVDALYKDAQGYIDDADYTPEFRQKARAISDWAQKKKIDLSNVDPNKYDPTTGIPQLSEQLPSIGTPDFTPEYLQKQELNNQLPALKIKSLLQGMNLRGAALAETARHHRAMEAKGGTGDAKLLNGFLAAVGAHNDWEKTADAARNMGAYAQPENQPENLQSNPKQVNAIQSTVAKKYATARSLWGLKAMPFLSSLAGDNTPVGRATTALAQKHNGLATPEDFQAALKDAHTNYWQDSNTKSDFGQWFDLMRNPLTAAQGSGVSMPDVQDDTEDDSE